MKQLKIIADQYDSQYSVSRASFNESITIAPHSRIWLDKISMNVISGGGNGNIVIGDQTISFSPNKITGPNSIPSRSVVIPGGTYTLATLLGVIQDKLNSNLYTSIAINTQSKIPDLGLGFLVTSAIKPQTTDPYVTISFFGATCIRQQNVVETNFSLTNNLWTVRDSLANFSALVYPTQLLAGGLLIETALLTPSIGLGTDTIVFGLYDKLPSGPALQLNYGLNRDADGQWYIVNNGVRTLMTNPALLNQNFGQLWTFRKLCFYIDPVDVASNGLRFAIVDTSNPNVRTILYTTPLGAFAGYTTTQPWYFIIEHDPDHAGGPTDSGQWLDPFVTYQPNILNDNVGSYIDFTTIGTRTYISTLQAPLGIFPVLPYNAPPVRNVAISFQNAIPLGQGLGFSVPVLPTITGQNGTITAPNKVNFIPFVDLALDILNLPLATYISSADTTGRTNTLAYFTPQPIKTTSDSLYYFENKNITFIDIANETPLTIEALTYRLYNPVDLNSYYLFNNLSITMFISEPTEGMDIRPA